MNVFFNNKKIIITEIDSEQTIKNKICIELETLPKYLYFPNGFPKSFNENETYIVEDLLTTIKNYVSTKYVFSELYNMIYTKFTMTFNILLDIITPFIIYNNNFIDTLNTYKSMNGGDLFISTILDPLYKSLTELQISFDQNELLNKLINYKANIKNFEKKIKSELLK